MAVVPSPKLPLVRTPPGRHAGRFAMAQPRRTPLSAATSFCPFHLHSLLPDVLNSVLSGPASGGWPCAGKATTFVSRNAPGLLKHHLLRVSSAAYWFILTISARICICLYTSGQPRTRPAAEIFKGQWRCQGLWTACSYVGSSEGPRADFLPLIYGQQSLTHL